MCCVVSPSLDKRSPKNCVAYLLRFTYLPPNGGTRRYIIIYNKRP